MTKRPSKLIPLESLPNGTYFQVGGLEKYYKNLIVDTVHSGHVKVSGWFRDDVDGKGWRRVSTSFSPRTEVYFVEPEEVPHNEEAIEVGEVSESNKVKGKSVAPKVRGRHKVHNVAIPKTPFTVKELSAKLKVKPYVINNEMNRLRAAGQEFKQLKKNKQAGKGKPAVVWQLA